MLVIMRNRYTGKQQTMSFRDREEFSEFISYNYSWVLIKEVCL